MIADIDKDGSGFIDFEEFLHMMTGKMDERDSRGELQKSFRLFANDDTVSILPTIVMAIIAMQQGYRDYNNTCHHYDAGEN